MSRNYGLLRDIKEVDGPKWKLIDQIEGSLTSRRDCDLREGLFQWAFDDMAGK